MPWITYGDASGNDFTLPAPEKARFGGDRGCERPRKGGTGRDSGGTAEEQWERQWEGQREQIYVKTISALVKPSNAETLYTQRPK